MPHANYVKTKRQHIIESCLSNSLPHTRCGVYPPTLAGQSVDRSAYTRDGSGQSTKCRRGERGWRGRKTTYKHVEPMFELLQDTPTGRQTPSARARRLMTPSQCAVLTQRIRGPSTLLCTLETATVSARQGRSFPRLFSASDKQ